MQSETGDIEYSRELGRLQLPAWTAGVHPGSIYMCICSPSYSAIAGHCVLLLSTLQPRLRRLLSTSNHTRLSADVGSRSRNSVPPTAGGGEHGSEYGMDADTTVGMELMLFLSTILPVLLLLLLPPRLLQKYMHLAGQWSPRSTRDSPLLLPTVKCSCRSEELTVYRV